jgi:predicted RNA-binding Zn-ribbon protein involved in translation (DUF1610 family)
MCKVSEALDKLSKKDLHKVNQGLLCPVCGGDKIKFVGANYDGRNSNNAYDCKTCPAKWEGY